MQIKNLTESTIDHFSVLLGSSEYLKIAHNTIYVDQMQILTALDYFSIILDTIRENPDMLECLSNDEKQQVLFIMNIYDKNLVDENE